MCVRLAQKQQGVFFQLRRGLYSAICNVSPIPLNELELPFSIRTLIDFFRLTAKEQPRISDEVLSAVKALEKNRKTQLGICRAANNLRSKKAFNI